MADTPNAKWIKDRFAVVNRYNLIRENVTTFENKSRNEEIPNNEILRDYYDICRDAKAIAHDAQTLVRTAMPDEPANKEEKQSASWLSGRAINTKMYEATRAYDISETLNMMLRDTRPKLFEKLDQRESETRTFYTDEAHHFSEWVKDPDERARLDKTLSERGTAIRHEMQEAIRPPEPTKSHSNEGNLQMYGKDNEPTPEITPAAQVKPEVAETDEEVFADYFADVSDEDLLASFTNGTPLPVKPDAGQTNDRDEPEEREDLAELHDEKMVTIYEARYKGMEAPAYGPSEIEEITNQHEWDRIEADAGIRDEGDIGPYESRKTNRPEKPETASESSSESKESNGKTYDFKLIDEVVQDAAEPYLSTLFVVQVSHDDKTSKMGLYRSESDGVEWDDQAFDCDVYDDLDIDIEDSNAVSHLIRGAEGFVSAHLDEIELAELCENNSEEVLEPDVAIGGHEVAGMEAKQERLAIPTPGKYSGMIADAENQTKSQTESDEIKHKF
jgi:hypothetical protein